MTQLSHLPADHPGADVAAVLLAGGLARRMGGGDKCLRRLGGGTLLTAVIDRVRPQVAALALNANGDAERFAAYGLPVLGDPLPDAPGPLAGILAGLLWMRQGAPTCRWLLSLPTDTPFLPADLVARLKAAVTVGGAAAAQAASGGRGHPVVGLWPVTAAAALQHALQVEGERRVQRFAARYRPAQVAWPVLPFDPFFNANSPDDLREAERLRAAMPAGAVAVPTGSAARGG